MSSYQKASTISQRQDTLSGTPYRFNQTKVGGIVIPAGQSIAILDEREAGYLRMFELHGNNSLLGIEVNVYGTDGTHDEMNDFHDTFQALLQLGWGSSPADVALVAGVSKDPHGTPNTAHPFLTRYKTSIEADALGNTGQWYSMGFTPVPAIEYQSRITVALFNTDKVNSATVRAFVMSRRTLI